MAVIIATIQVMPDSPDQDLKQLANAAKPLFEEFGATIESTDTEPVAFGIKALNIKFSADEDKGDLEPLEQKISNIPGVRSVRTTAISRSMG